MLGFGVEAAIVLVTPVALQVAKDVVGFVREQLRERAREQGEGAIERIIDRIFERGDGDEGEAEPADGAHRRAARAGARARAREGPAAEAHRRGANCSRTRSSGAWRRHERRAGPTGARPA